VLRQRPRRRGALASGTLLETTSSDHQAGMPFARRRFLEGHTEEQRRAVIEKVTRMLVGR
jgi:hypothetical protein